MATQRNFSSKKALLYALPAAPLAALGLPITVYIPPFYASQLGIELATIGMIMMVMKLWDVATDPILGILSDKYPSRWGRRRHWLVLSGPILIITAWFLFMPTPPVGPTYLTVTLVILYIGWTLANISHMSWGAELSPYYEGRSKIQGWREAIVLIGMLCVMVLPAVVELVGPDNLGFTDRGEDTLAFARVSAMGWFVILLLPISIMLAVTFVGERQSADIKEINWREMIPLMVKNPALKRILICDLMSGLSGGTVASLFLFLAENALKLERASLLLLFYFGMGLVCLPFLLKLSNRLTKHKTLGYSYLFQFLTTWLILVIPTGSTGMAVFVISVLGINMGLASALYRSMMADVSDDHTVRTGHDQTGVMYSLLSLTNKIGYAFAVGVTYTALAAIGFDAKGDNDPDTLMQLRMVFVLVPTILGGLITWIIWKYPITPEKQEENRHILETRLGQRLQDAGAE